MAKSASSLEQMPIKLPSLLIPRQEADKQIQDRILEGNKQLNLEFHSIEDLVKGEKQKNIWHEFNVELLNRIFSTDKIVNEYSHTFGIWGGNSFAERVQEYHDDLNMYISRLESIKNRLILIPEPDEFNPSEINSVTQKRITNKVFIVHGHDEEAKHSVARTIEKLGLEAIILHEQPNQSRTIIEKFEANSDVAFAIILLTPDDLGTNKNDPRNLKPRARQNVILELGYFIGKLSRNRVCALHKGNLEIPTDFSGILWVEMDQAGKWKLDLGREMKAAGLDVDLNNLV